MIVSDMLHNMLREMMGSEMVRALGTIGHPFFFFLGVGGGRTVILIFETKEVDSPSLPVALDRGI